MPEAAEEEVTGYMERTRQYYRALGYTTDYVWSHYEEVPFTGLGKPLSQSPIALVTTAGPADRSNKDSAGRKCVWSGPVTPPPDALSTDMAWDRESTHTDDLECFLPIKVTEKLAAEGIIAGLGDRFVGVPTVYSQRQTIEQDAPEVLRIVREDGADAVILCAL